MILLKKLDRTYNDAMLSILASSPMETHLMELFFDKSPDMFMLSDLWSDKHTYYGIFVDEILAGFGMYLIYKGFVGGQINEISYIGNFCIDKKYRGRGLFYQLAEHILKEYDQKGEFGFCMILQGNKSAERYFDERKRLLATMPVYQKIGSYETRSILITKRKRIINKYQIRKAEKTDVKSILNLLHLEYDKKMLAQEINVKIFNENISRRDGFNIENYLLAFDGQDLVGVCATWDMKSIRRTRILKYKRRILIIKMLYKIIASILGYPSLPKPGEALKEVYITHIAVIGKNPKILEALLRSIYNEFKMKKYNLIHFASFKNDPLLVAAKPFFSTPLYSNIYFSSKNDQLIQDSSNNIDKPYIDITLI